MSGEWCAMSDEWSYGTHRSSRRRAERLAEGDDVGAAAHAGQLGRLVDHRGETVGGVPMPAAARSHATAVSSSPRAPAARATVAAINVRGWRS